MALAVYALPLLKFLDTLLTWWNRKVWTDELIDFCSLLSVAFVNCFL